MPVPDFVGAALGKLVFGQGSLPQALGQELLRMTGARVSDEAWAEAAESNKAPAKATAQGSGIFRKLETMDSLDFPTTKKCGPRLTRQKRVQRERFIESTRA